MVCKFRLKTGFFETKICTLSIKDSSIRIFSDDIYENNGLLITENNLLNISVIVKQDHPVEIELHTLDTIYTGYCIDEHDPEDIVKILINEFDSKVCIEN